MDIHTALDVIERAKSLIDDGVSHAGDFGSLVQYVQAKNLRREYKVAIRTLKKSIDSK